MPVLIVACGGKEPTPDPVKLAANPTELTFGPEGGTQTLTITSGIQPAVSSLGDWITITAGTPSGNNYPYSVKVSAYNGTLDRSSSLRVIGDKQSLMITVLQRHPEVELTVSKTALSFSRTGGEETFTVYSSTQPHITTDASWLVIETGKIDQNHQTTVKALAGASRKTEAGAGIVTVSCEGKSVSVAVSQEAFVAPATAATTAVTPQMVFHAMGPG